MAVAGNPEPSEHPHQSLPSSKSPKRFFRSFSFAHNVKDHKSALPAVQLGQRLKKARDSATFAQHFIYSPSISDKRAKETALVARSLILGHSDAVSSHLTANAKSRLEQVKGSLLQPKTANKVIAQLRALPHSDVVVEGKEDSTGSHAAGASRPIRAVCLEHPDAEQYRLHFASLVQASTKESSILSRDAAIIPSVSLDKLSAKFKEMNIVNLLLPPDLGLGQPGNGNGILSGAVPTPETILNGFRQITPELMNLGYATGQAITPDHTGIYPPTDRISVLTYWWGLELLLPPPTLKYLSNAQSISGTIINFLTALSLVNDGVREVLPFIRYIAQFMDFEFDNIKAQDEGRGVVCAATWIMPVAMVPRPWDFPEKPELEEAVPTSPHVDSPIPSVPADAPKISSTVQAATVSDTAK